MRAKIGRLAALLGLAAALAAAAPVLPGRPADAEPGSAFAVRWAALPPDQRDGAVVAEIRRGNVPGWWRHFVRVPVKDGWFEVAPDYLAVGADDDFVLTPLGPVAAQEIADALDCRLPTPRMVDLIHAQAVKLEPAPRPPAPDMTTVPAFLAHGAAVAEQRRALGDRARPGVLLAGHKKDVVLSARLQGRADRVAIYGWHRPDGSAIQPVFTGHAAAWVDYSHGIRLVARTMTWAGQPTTLDAVLADEARWPNLSDEGPLAPARFGQVAPVLPVAGPGEAWTALFPAPGVRVLVNRPREWQPGRPTRLVLYALPAGNTIEHTAGRIAAPGDDWHFAIQHLAAQTRWLRREGSEPNLVVAYLECAGLSWTAWRRRHADAAERAVRLVDAVAAEFPEARLTLASHSAGGALIFAYLDGVAALPARIERIAWLDSNYAYDSSGSQAQKLAAWLDAGDDRFLSVLAYEDHRALLDGRTFVSAEGGTWGRSQAMLADLGRSLAFARSSLTANLTCVTALGHRVEFLLLANPEQKVWHTRQVELNGFIHALLAGTARAGQGYRYLGDRVYDADVLPGRSLAKASADGRSP